MARIRQPRPNMAHLRHPQQDSGLAFQVIVVNIFQVFPLSLGSGPWGRCCCCPGNNVKVYLAHEKSRMRTGVFQTLGKELLLPRPASSCASFFIFAAVCSNSENLAAVSVLHVPYSAVSVLYVPYSAVFVVYVPYRRRLLTPPKTC